MIKTIIGGIFIILGIASMIYTLINIIKEIENESLWVKILAIGSEFIPTSESSVLIGVILILFGIFVAVVL